MDFWKVSAEAVIIGAGGAVFLYVIWEMVRAVVRMIRRRNRARKGRRG